MCTGKDGAVPLYQWWNDLNRHLDQLDIVRQNHIRQMEA